jgi:hypothetical protein
MAFRVTPDARGKSEFLDNSDKLCNHCNREGHDESSVFKFMGSQNGGGIVPGVDVGLVVAEQHKGEEHAVLVGVVKYKHQQQYF